MGSASSRSSTETSPSTWRRSRPMRAAWSSFVTRCEDWRRPSCYARLAGASSASCRWKAGRRWCHNERMTLSHWRLGMVLAVIGLASCPPAAFGETPPPFLSKWGSLGSGDGQFDYPFLVATDTGGDLYVPDYHNNRIQR